MSQEFVLLESVEVAVSVRMGQQTKMLSLSTRTIDAPSIARRGLASLDRKIQKKPAGRLGNVMRRVLSNAGRGCAST